MNNWDYIVVGAGSAGCALADQLTASGGKRVLLLEAGLADNSLTIRVPLAAAALDIKRFDWGYDSAPDPTRNGKSEHWTRGRVVGGTSSINGMNYVRGSASDYDRWARMGNVGWSARDVMPLFRQFERCDATSIHQSDEIRGRDGLLHVRMVKDRHPITESFIKSAQEAHYPFTPDYNGAIQEGVGYAQLNQRRRSRWSAADAFLRPALRRKNFRLITNAHVHRLVIKNRRVTGVMYEIGGIMHEASASRIVLCAGAINTPHLLMLSGIGDARELSENGIKVTLDRRAVGKNLMEHPLVRLVYRMSAPTHNVSGALHGVRLLAKYLMRGHGPIACVFESIAFLRSTSGELAPDIQLHVAAFGYDAIRRGSKSVIQMLPYPSMTILVNKNYPVSRGRIRLASASPKALPIIEPRILESEQDLMTLVNGLTTVRRIMAAKPIADLVVEEIQPGTAYPNIESLASYVRDNTEIAYHPAGTCRMGVDDEAVVTPQLQVRGIENLWIADASIMPDLISGNTNAACMMIGVKLGRQLIEMRE